MKNSAYQLLQNDKDKYMTLRERIAQLRKEYKTASEIAEELKISEDTVIDILIYKILDLSVIDNKKRKTIEKELKIPKPTLDKILIAKDTVRNDRQPIRDSDKDLKKLQSSDAKLFHEKRPGGRPKKEVDRERMYQLKKQGKTIREIAKELKVSVGLVCGKLKQDKAKQ